MVKNIEKNFLREIRESLMMSNTELSRNSQGGDGGLKKMIIPKECEDCLYIKLRNADPETIQLAWEPFCLQSGVLIKCEETVSKCIVQRLKKTVVRGI